MGIEIEAKFRVDDDRVFHWLLSLFHIGHFQLFPESDIERQRNTYFDTHIARLQSLSYSLRIREVGKRRTATLKRSRSKQGSLRIRDEWEAPIGADDDPRRWPAGELRDRVLLLIGDASLEPLFVVETRRHYVHVVRGGQPIADICLDSGSIKVESLEQPFRELEVELLDPAERVAFDSLVTLLCLSFPLIPEERGKKSRGLALRAAATARALALGGDHSLPRAGRHAHAGPSDTVEPA
ncbi:MAG TPA: CYTH domain-containing protein [Roseiflexaceae bacterium]